MPRSGLNLAIHKNYLECVGSCDTTAASSYHVDARERCFDKRPLAM